MAQFDLHLLQNIAASGVEFTERLVNISKGSLLTAAADGSPLVLPAGSNGYVLVADSTAASGLKWQTLIGGDGHTQNTDTGTTSNTFTFDSDSTTGKILLNVVAGASNYTLTLQNTALTGARTITFPDATGTVALLQNKLSDFAATSSAELRAVISDETGTGGGLVFATGPTLSGPVIDDVKASAVGATADLFSEVTTGSIALGAGLTTGALNIAAAGTGATPINIGHTNATTTITGTVKLPTVGTSGLVAIGAGGTLSATTSYVSSVNGSTGAITNVALTTGKLSQFAATTSAELAGVISDETGYTTGAVLVFNTSPSFKTSVATSSTTLAVFDTTATTVNAFGAATTLSLGYDGTAASTTNIATGITASAATKEVNIGTGGGTGSTTNVNIGSASGGTVTVGNHLVVGGNLTVSGTVTTINTETVTINDNIIVLNNNAAAVPSENAGIEVERGDSTNASLIWDESTDTWKAGLLGSEVALALSDHNHTLDSLSNVTITSNSSGEILKWNGSAWVNSTLAEAGILTTSSMWVTAPTTKTSAGTAGQMAYDANYVYVCTAANTWKRAAIATNWQ